MWIVYTCFECPAPQRCRIYLKTANYKRIFIIMIWLSGMHYSFTFGLWNFEVSKNVRRLGLFFVSSCGTTRIRDVVLRFWLECFVVELDSKCVICFLSGYSSHPGADKRSVNSRHCRLVTIFANEENEPLCLYSNCLFTFHSNMIELRFSAIQKEYLRNDARKLWHYSGCLIFVSIVCRFWLEFGDYYFTLKCPIRYWYALDIWLNDPKWRI